MTEPLKPRIDLRSAGGRSESKTAQTSENQAKILPRLADEAMKKRGKLKRLDALRPTQPVAQNGDGRAGSVWRSVVGQGCSGAERLANQDWVALGDALGH
ncbi:MAG: hypothetical protein ACLR9P_06585 [Escherichia coli]